MNRPAWGSFAAGLLMLAPMLMPAASVPIPAWVSRRFNPESVQVSDIQGISERIHDGKLNLMLKDFLELVLKNSTDINVTRMDVYTAADQVKAAHAVFDPAVALGFNTLRVISPQVSQTGGAATLSSLTENSYVNYQQLLPTGQTASVGFTGTRSSSNSEFNIVNPDIYGQLNFSFTQPLLQNRTGIQFKAPIQIARTQLTITSRLDEAHIADLIATAAGQYWDTVRARDNIKVLQQTLDLAQKSYDRDKQALDLGALAALDIYQSETQVAQRKTDLVQAQYAYRAALDSLRRLIGADLKPEWRATEIVLEDDPAKVPDRAGILPYEQALTAAMRIRPELDAAHRRVTIDDLNARVAKNLMLPHLDLTVQAQGAGLSGDQVAQVSPLGITTPAASGGLWQSLGQVLVFNAPGYGAGLQLTLPFRSTAASAQLADALVSRTRDHYTERQVEQQIIQDVRQALTSIDLANASIQSATLTRDLAQKNVDAEQQKYELGTITAFEVLDSQTRLATAESSLLNAFVGYQEAYVSYQRATWTLLDGLGMVLETPKVN
ncbi:MAG TPA: TolC family protein [Bryobacteraceae bacterium]|jgi:outer membrane protein TolC|nr:TolC family protein [Bryobacteraceae bacterium]